MPTPVLRKKGTTAERLELEYPETGGRRYPSPPHGDPYSSRVLNKAVKDDTLESFKHLGRTNERWASLEAKGISQAKKNFEEERAFRKRKDAESKEKAEGQKRAARKR